MTAIYKQMLEGQWPKNLRYVLIRGLSEIDTPWFKSSLVNRPLNLLHKTGSMIDCGKLGDTVYNAAGSFMLKQNTYYFTVFSRGYLRDNGQFSPTQMRMYVAGLFEKQLENITRLRL
jgi:hypothetical protein